MTPEEAIEIIWERHMDCEDYRFQFDDYPDGYDFEFDQAILMAAQALEEIQKYREIGTVEECREAMEKQKPQKPKDSLKIDPVIDENGAYVDADTTVYLLCPNCGEMVGIEDNCDRFCHECRQAIDNENLEGMEDENT